MWPLSKIYFILVATCFRGTTIGVDWAGDIAATMPMPWDVPCPSCVNIVIHIICYVLYKFAASNWCSVVCHNYSTFFKCLELYELQKPCWWSKPKRNLELKWWCICMANPIWSGRPTTSTLGLVAWAEAWPRDACFFSLLFLFVPTIKMFKLSRRKDVTAYVLLQIWIVFTFFNCFFITFYQLSSSFNQPQSFYVLTGIFVMDIVIM